MATDHHRQVCAQNDPPWLYHSDRPSIPKIPFLVTTDHPTPREQRTQQSSARRSANSRTKKGHTSHKFPQRSHLIPSIPRHQKIWKIQNDPQPKETKSLCSKSTVQDGKSLQNLASNPMQRVGSNYRPVGCLPTRPCSPLVTESARLRDREKNICLSSSPIRTSLIPSHLHSHSKSSRSRTTRERDKNILLSRRLADSRPLTTVTKQTGSDHNRSRHQSGVYHKQREIKTNPNPEPRISGGIHRYPKSKSNAITSQNPKGARDGFQPTPCPKVLGQILAGLLGFTGKPSGCGTSMQTAHENSPNPPTKIPMPNVTGKQDNGSQQFQDSSSNSVVAASPQSNSRETFSSPPSNPHDPNGCIETRLGSSARSRPNRGGMEPSGKKLAHQQIGNGSCPTGPPTFSDRDRGEVNPHKVRQQDCSGFYQPSGGNQIKNPVLPNIGNPSVVHQPGNLHPGIVHTGQGQLHCRFHITGEISTDGMDAPPRDNETHLQSIWPAVCRPICFGTEQTITNILHKTQGPQGPGNRCVLDPVEQRSQLRLSSLCNHHKGTDQSPGGECHHPPNRPVVAPSTMVSNSGEPSERLPSNPTRQKGHTETTGDNTVLPESFETETNTLANYRATALAAGLSERAADLTAQCLRESTRSTYDSRLLHYIRWCRESEIDPPKVSLGELAEFLISLYDKGLSLNTIRGYRSAIAVIHKGFSNGESVSSSIMLTRLMKSFFLTRPSKKTLSPAWSLPKVLQTLSRAPYEPLHKASLKDLTIKTVFLLTTASGQRRSSVHALTTSSGHIRWEKNKVRLLPHARFLAKNQRESSQPLEIVLPSIQSLSSIAEDKLWCPVRALKWYINRTQNLRSSEQLFVSCLPPHKAVSRDTISRWIVSAIKSAGQVALLSDRIRAHDTRGLAASWALFNGASMEDILNAAYWSSSNTFTACYLSDVLQTETEFARAVLSCSRS